ncbi:MAG: helix-turn-helix domain-containing protein [Methylophilaceae bacterium]
MYKSEEPTQTITSNGFPSNNIENLHEHTAGEDIRSPLTRKFPRGYMKKRLEEIDPQYKNRAIQARQALAIEQSDFKPVSLATLRLRKGLTQHELAANIGTSQSHIAKIESGSLKVYLITAIKISQALEISLDELSRCIQLDQELSIKQIPVINI